jgi:3-oxoacyl-[acyl-carrier-protein] synthase III
MSLRGRTVHHLKNSQHGTIYPGEPAIAALIQEDIGANPEDPHDDAHGTFSFDIANGTFGVLIALQIVDGFLRS